MTGNFPKEFEQFDAWFDGLAFDLLWQFKLD